MSIQPVIMPRAADAATPDPRPIVSYPLFVSESFIGVLVSVKPGQAVPLHIHEHKDEAFDVVLGEGVILVAGRKVQAKPGTLVFVPAGTEHGLHNPGAADWLLRETVHERVYACSALRLVWLAFLKRLPVVGKRWRN